MKFYVQTNKDNYITDCITYPYKNYKPCNFPTPLPNGFIAGYYKLIDSDSFEIDKDKFSEIMSDQASELHEQEVDVNDDYIKQSDDKTTEITDDEKELNTL